jgi:hypothetical protein
MVSVSQQLRRAIKLQEGKVKDENKGVSFGASKRSFGFTFCPQKHDGR